jgi:hypothetical protein
VLAVITRKDDFQRLPRFTRHPDFIKQIRGVDMISKFTDYQLLMAGYFLLVVANIGQFAGIIYLISIITRRIKDLQDDIDNNNVDTNHRIDMLIKDNGGQT